MRSNHGLWNVVAMVALGLVAVWFSTSWGQGRNGYQTETQVYTTPEYRTDTTRAIDAYEKLMTRYMDATERDFANLGLGMKSLTAKLDALDAKLTALDTRLARIEKHLGIAPETGGDPNTPTVLPQKAKPQAILDVPVHMK